jgi:serine/threonine protein kinase
MLITLSLAALQGNKSDVHSHASCEQPWIALCGKLISLMYGGADRIVNVDYTIPEKPIVSEACKDLLRKLIVLDPEHRLTIPQIAQHPWFREGLPADIFSVNDRSAHEQNRG